MHALFNAAREYIGNRLKVIEENHFGDYTTDDLASAKREQTEIERQITAIERLHDFLSDMIEGGRLTEHNIPDDYQAIVETLALTAN